MTEAPAVPLAEDAPTLGGEDIVFIADDDEDLLLEDEWQSDTIMSTDISTHLSQVELQLRLCYTCAVMLLVLLVLIALAWRRYGEAINEAAACREASQVRSGRKED